MLASKGRVLYLVSFYTLTLPVFNNSDGTRVDVLFLMAAGSFDVIVWSFWESSHPGLIGDSNLNWLEVFPDAPKLCTQRSCCFGSSFFFSAVLAFCRISLGRNEICGTTNIYLYNKYMSKQSMKLNYNATGAEGDKVDSKVNLFSAEKVLCGHDQLWTVSQSMKYYMFFMRRPTDGRV